MTPAARLRFLAKAAVIAALLCGAAACSTKVGNDLNQTPQAIITPIGIQPSSGAGTSAVAMTVRAGSLVILSAKDSNGQGAALSGFHFVQTDGPSLPLPPDTGALLYQTSNTVEFTAPRVTEYTSLTFTLTVTNALNLASTATATVNVVPANDDNEFLVPTVVDINPTHPRRFSVAVATTQGLAAPLSAPAVACIRVQRTLSYLGRDAKQHTLILPALANLQADAAWSSTLGGMAASGEAPPFSAALQSASNPRVVFDVPEFNDVELAALFNQPGFGGGGYSTGISQSDQDQELVASDVDSAVMSLSVSATAGSCDGTVPASSELSNATFVLGIYPPAGITPTLTNGGAGSLDQYNPNATLACSSANPCVPLTADNLLTAITPPLPQQADSVQGPPQPPSGSQAAIGSAAETLATAQAYYAAVDPGATKTNLNDWLDANCFDHTQSDYGTGAAGENGAHAVYTNNFDLGFGRDMYFIRCTADHTNAAGAVTAHAGDMASVVINYVSLEEAALKQSSIIAVAMEYQGVGNSNGNCASSQSSACIAKFYVFALDDRTGVFQRISSANFDRRGEKYVPGACLSCHGGAITDLTFAKDAKQSGNVDAAFMPWDLDALLYSDTDPAFQGNLVGADPYTRAAQEPNLKKLNYLASLTWQHPEWLTNNGVGSCTGASATCTDRFASLNSLVTTWYAGVGPSNAQSQYSDVCTPAGWPGASSNCPLPRPTTTPNDIYHTAYAHHCRACHTPNNVIAKQFNDFSTFETTYIEQSTSGKTLQQLLYKNAQMPLARLTMDRFWVNFDSTATPGAQTLATFINGLSGVTSIPSADASSAASPELTIEPPGAPVFQATNVYENVDLSSSPTIVSATGSEYVVARFGASAANSASAVSAAGVRVDFSPSVFTSSYTSSLCVQETSNPSDGTPCSAASTLVGGDSALPAFDTSQWGYYNLTLNASSASGQATKVVHLQVPLTVPNIACAQVSTSAPAAATTSVVTFPAGCQMGDTGLLQILNPATNQWLPSAAPPKTLPAAPTPNSLNAQVTGADYTIALTGCLPSAPSSCSIAVTFATTATYTPANPLRVSYRFLDQYDNIASPTTPTSGAIASVSVARNYSLNSLTYDMTLTPNYSGGPPTATNVCLPIASACPSSSGAVVPFDQIVLGGEISPADDSFVWSFLNFNPTATLPDSVSPATLNTSLVAGGNATLALPAGSTFTGLGDSLVTCDVNGHEINDTATPCSGLQIAYSVVSNSVGSASCASSPSTGPGYACNSFAVRVDATASFSQSTSASSAVPSGLTGQPIFGILSSSTRCASCHSEPSPAVAPANCSTDSAQALCKWWLVATSASQTLSYLETSTSSQFPNCIFGSTPCVTAGDPSQSEMYKNVCSAVAVNGHGPVQPNGTVPAEALTQSECSTLSEWIAEGANLD